MSKVISSCSLNCWDNCGFEVTVENGRVVKVDGDKNHPITKGKICGRGRMLETRTNSEERLLYPLKKENGLFKEISWEQAFQEIAEKMKGIKLEFGPLAVLHSHDYSNGGLLKSLDQRFFNCYGGVTELTGSICWGAGIEAQRWDFGNSWSHAPEDIFNSKHVVIWGRNVVRTNMHLYQYLLEVKKKGTKIIVIDPISNATAKMADHYVQIKPGMDGILALGIIKELVRLNLEDKEFINGYTIGFSDLLELVNSITFDEIVERTNVSRETISLLAKSFADRPTATFLGLGMQRYTNGGNTIRLINALVAVSGNIGISGGGSNYGNLQVGQSFDYGALTLPQKKEETRTFTMMQQAKGILEAVDPKIKMIIVTCGNPLTQVPDTNLVKKAFESVDTLVVIDQFMTDTAVLADYVLPTTTVFEEEDIYFSSMYHHYANYGPKLVDPPGEAKSDLWIWTRLAELLGFGEDFHYSRREFLQLGLGYLEEKGITLEQFLENNHVELPVDHVPWSDYRFTTPSGKFEFTSATAFEKGYNGKLSLLFPEESTNNELLEKYPYTLLTIHPMRSNHSQHYHLIESMQQIKVDISIDIARENGLSENDSVRVYNDRGEVKGIVKILENAHPTTINIDEGQWSKYGGSVNLLTPDRVSDNGLGSTLYDCLVNIEKI
ncbi:molybdopterin-dependent oxidoreductase [Bacillus luteolus]|uniref:Molybdopterin-dependent oxidoreductase n=1 Tax=Litchfieldia luteola TaxID=682179 RepID=A0ABR9QHE8_9BACI|nr:molybdopterin-dependent oxidoreductase [Cytobacillus luteolus]MBE4907903.1 molybdopterin-dependent oxidoreductase [Cytobacillus luteolus]